MGATGSFKTSAALVAVALAGGCAGGSGGDGLGTWTTTSSFPLINCGNSGGVTTYVGDPKNCPVGSPKALELEQEAEAQRARDGTFRSWSEVKPGVSVSANGLNEIGETSTTFVYDAQKKPVSFSFSSIWTGPSFTFNPG